MILGQQLQLDWIVRFQGDGALREPMVWISYLGYEAIPYILPFFYLVISNRSGSRLYLLYSFNWWLVEMLKQAFHSPRPYWIDPHIPALATSSNYGFPSGHVVAACIVCFSVAEVVRARWTRIAASVVILSVSASRIYLGVHFITDIVGALLIAAALVSSFDFLQARLAKLAISMRAWQEVFAACWLASAMLLFGLLVHSFVETIADPPAWSGFSRNARSASPMYQSTGQFLGAAVGIIMARKSVRLDTTKPLENRLVTFAYGLLLMKALNYLYSFVLVPDNSGFLQGWNFLREMLSTWSILFLAPRILGGVSVPNLRNSIMRRTIG